MSAGGPWPKCYLLRTAAIRELGNLELTSTKRRRHAGLLRKLRRFSKEEKIVLCASILYQRGDRVSVLGLLLLTTLSPSETYLACLSI